MPVGRLSRLSRASIKSLPRDGPKAPAVPKSFEDANLSRLLEASPPEEVVGPSGQVYRSTSLFCLRPWHQPRRGAIFLVESPLFDPIIMLTILANCLTLAWQTPLEPQGTSKAAFIDACEWVYLVIFTIEMLAKIIAYRPAVN